MPPLMPEPKIPSIRKTEEEGVDSILNQRASTYGKFSGQAAISQALKNILEAGVSYNSMSPAQKESAGMICHKLARIVNGDPNYQDSWVDIAGYATLISDSIKGIDR